MYVHATHAHSHPQTQTRNIPKKWKWVFLRKGKGQVHRVCDIHRLSSRGGAINTNIVLIEIVTL